MQKFNLDNVHIKIAIAALLIAAFICYMAAYVTSDIVTPSF